jgi:hypothetical protein
VRAAILICFALAIGCKREEPESAPRTETAPAESPSTTEATSPVEAATDEPAAAGEPTATDVPIAEDFAEDAERRIAAENYPAELDRIEREIEADLAAARPEGAHPEAANP